MKQPAKRGFGWVVMLVLISVLAGFGGTGLWHIQEKLFSFKKHNSEEANCAERGQRTVTITGGPIWVDQKAPAPFSNGDIIAKDGLGDIEMYVFVKQRSPETFWYYEVTFYCSHPRAYLKHQEYSEKYHKVGHLDAPLVPQKWEDFADLLKP